MEVSLSIVILLLLFGFGLSIFFLHRYYMRRLKREIRRAQKSEQLKSVFIDNISRSLRSPLNAVLGYSNLILEEKDESMQPAYVKELATKINNNTQQLVDFVSQLYEMSKFEGITPSFTFIEVNLTELFASYRRETMNLTKPEIAVRVRSDLSPHCKAFLDTNCMHQLMMHLLTNAARHATQGDIIITYGYERKGIRVSISFIGVGQAEVIGADIYSFLQKDGILENTKESSALCLSLSRAIVEILGGEFSIDTLNGLKTTATFWFPCKMRDKHMDYVK